MAVTLHQLRCFLATVEHGSFTRAAEDLHLSQPALAEQVRELERQIGAVLFHRLARGVNPTDAAVELRPYAASAISSVVAGTRAAVGSAHADSGTVRFGLFGAAHLYIAGDLVARVLEEHPLLRISLIGQNSRDVISDILGGRLEAGLVALPVEEDGQLAVVPVARDDLVYLSANRERTLRPVTPDALAAADLVLSEASWGERDFTRRQLLRAAQVARQSLRVRVEVENVETALDIAARGLADTVAARGVYEQLKGQLPHRLHFAPLDPAISDHFAVVHRQGTKLSRPSRIMIDTATQLMRAATWPESEE